MLPNLLFLFPCLEISVSLLCPCHFSPSVPSSVSRQPAKGSLGSSSPTGPLEVSHCGGGSCACCENTRNGEPGTWTETTMWIRTTETEKVLNEFRRENSTEVVEKKTKRMTKTKTKTKTESQRNHSQITKEAGGRPTSAEGQGKKTTANKAKARQALAVSGDANSDDGNRHKAAWTAGRT